MSLVPYSVFKADRTIVTKLFLMGLLIALLGIAVDSVAIVRMGADSPTGGDGPYFIGIARSLAEGRGYYLENSFWPDLPNVARSPLWPAILTIPSFLFSHANDNAILRFTGAVLHGLSAALLLPLTFQLTGSLAGAAFAGAILSLYPPASALVAGGYSEIAYLAVMLAGLILVAEGGRWLYAGAAVCGVSVLARSNFLLLPFLMAVLVVMFRPRIFANIGNVRRIVAASAVFLLFPSVWIIRNYLVSGYFPVLSAMEGETLYGGNNARVAADLNFWGYWVMPNEIPGEQTKKELAQTRSELELNKYYHDRAIRFMRENWYAMPRLIVGKLVRGFVPVPWVPLAASYLAFLFRGCVYAAFIAAAILGRNRNQPYLLLLSAMFLVTLVTTVVYYGTYRFTFCLEPFLFPCIAAGALPLGEAIRRGKSGVTKIGVHNGSRKSIVAVTHSD